ncbi:MAG: ELWxxDGT repeat protein [Planctomycetota bacterium]
MMEQDRPLRPQARPNLAFPLALALAIPLASTAAVAQRNHIANSHPTGIEVDAGGVAYFAASQEATGAELWRSDGTPGGTVMVADLEPGPRGSYPDDITPTPGDTFLTASTARLGRELYATDGTRTRLVRDIEDQAGSDPRDLTPVGNLLFFTAYEEDHGRELWVTDGTTPNTVRIEIVPGKSGASPHHLTALGSRLIFAATDRTGDTEIWTANGTPAGLRRLADIHPAESSRPSDLVKFRGEVYFAATSLTRGRELWKTDGTPAGTMMAADVLPGTAGSDPDQLVPGPTHLAFTAWLPGAGRELFEMDVTGTVRLLSNFMAGETLSNLTANPAPSAPMSPRFWCTVDEPGFGHEPWQIISGAAPTPVVDLQPGNLDSHPTNLTPLGDALVFRADGGGVGSELWCSNGVVTSLVADIRTGLGPKGPKSSDAARLTSGAPGEFWFAAESECAGIELWKTDGHRAWMVRDIDPGVPLPQLDAVTQRRGVSLCLTDAPALVPGLFGVSGGIPPVPLSVPTVRGAIMIDIFTPGAAVFVPFVTDGGGNAQANVGFPTQAQGFLGPLAWQAFALETGSSPCAVSEGAERAGADGDAATEVVVCSSNITCTLVGGGPTPDGAIVSGTGSACDDTGRYIIEIRRVDVTGRPAHLVAVRIKPSGEMVLLDPSEIDQGDPIVPIRSGQSLRLHGFVNLYTAVNPDDPLSGADAIGLLLFDEPPAQSELSVCALVWRSYC